MSRCRHANGPTSYVAKLAWLEWMSKRYKQVMCNGCGLYAKWERRKEGEKDE